MIIYVFVERKYCLEIFIYFLDCLESFQENRNVTGALFFIARTDEITQVFIDFPGFPDFLRYEFVGMISHKHRKAVKL